jgi:hypothetical protein
VLSPQYLNAKFGRSFQLIVIPAKAEIHPAVDTGLRRYDEKKIRIDEHRVLCAAP